MPPDINDELSSSDTLATEGMRVVLNCAAEGNPTPTIAWMREDGKKIRLCSSDKPDRPGGHVDQDRQTKDKWNRDIPLQYRRRKGGGGGSKRGKEKKKHCESVQNHYGPELELRQISRHDSGVYLCIASNGVPPSVSKRVRLYVDFPPTLWISHQRIGASMGGTAQLECLTAAHPPSLNFWSRDGDNGNYIIPTDGKFELKREDGEPSFYNVVMKLIIYNITDADFRTYRCLAKNPQGETSGEISLYENPRPSTTASYFSGNDVNWPEPEIMSTSNRTKLVYKMANSDFESGNYNKQNEKRKKARRHRKKHKKGGGGGAIENQTESNKSSSTDVGVNCHIFLWSLVKSYLHLFHHTSKM